MGIRVTHRIQSIMHGPSRARDLSVALGIALPRIRIALRSLKDRNVVHVVPSHGRTVLYVPGPKPKREVPVYDAFAALDAMRAMAREVGYSFSDNHPATLQLRQRSNARSGNALFARARRDADRVTSPPVSRFGYAGARSPESTAPSMRHAAP